MQCEILPCFIFAVYFPDKVCGGDDSFFQLHLRSLPDLPSQGNDLAINLQKSLQLCDIRLMLIQLQRGVKNERLFLYIELLLTYVKYLLFFLQRVEP